MPATNTDASLLVYNRNADGSNGSAASIYAAATGGSPLSQPINPTAAGNYDFFVSQPGRYNLVETINGVAMPVVAWEAVATLLETVIAPTFSGTWTNYALGFANAGYYKTSEGMVVLRGLIKSGTIGTSAFTLPAGYRPSSSLLFTVLSNGAIGRVDVTNTGTVVPTTPSTNAFVSLDSIYFRAEQ